GEKRNPQDGKIIEKTAEFVAKPKIRPPKKFLTAEQHDGGKLYSKKIYEETTQWIIAHGCETLIPKQLIEDYAQATARHIQCEEYLSEYGLIAKHPTTGEPIVSPFHKMNIENQKLSSQLWYQIFSAVRDNAPQGLIGGNPQDQMEKLLMFREASR
ncbi:MAG: terminase, partial [Selenomonadaceae bacterium]|nr:terminase [Selenomonadaceae bacterium]